MDDFYRMLWHTNASHVVMIANVIEKGKVDLVVMLGIKMEQKL